MSHLSHLNAKTFNANERDNRISTVHGQVVVSFLLLSLLCIVRCWPPLITEIWSAYKKGQTFSQVLQNHNFANQSERKSEYESKPNNGHYRLIYTEYVIFNGYYFETYTCHRTIHVTYI